MEMEKLDLPLEDWSFLDKCNMLTPIKLCQEPLASETPKRFVDMRKAESSTLLFGTVPDKAKPDTQSLST